MMVHLKVAFVSAMEDVTDNSSEGTPKGVL